MVELEIELSKYIDITPRELKILNIVVYNKLVIYAKSVDCLPCTALRVFQTHNTLSDVSICIQCDAEFDPYKKRGLTCCKSCQSLHMHEIRSPEVAVRRRNRAKLTNDRKRESGELTEISERAFRTRRRNNSETDIAEQYKRIGVSNTAAAKRRKLEKRANIISRIAVILIRKSPLLILRIFYANGGIKIYANLINELVNLGFDVFNNLRKSRFRYAAKNGLVFLTECIECGASCHFKNKFCSDKCKHINSVIRETRSVKLKSWNNIHENKEKMSAIRIASQTNKTPEERHANVKKIYAGKNQEWIDTKSRKAIDTRIARGQILPRDIVVTSEYKLYRNSVTRLTKANSFNIPNIHLRGKHTFHVDHIYPIVHGFLNEIPVELIGNLLNLQMLPAIENKQKNSTITVIPEHIQEWINANNN